MLNGHGNDLYDYPNKICFDFSSNIPYRNASAKIAAHLADKLHLINNYPDPNARKLTQQIAAHHNTCADNILVTNGSAEAFYLLAHLFTGKNSAISFPAFAEYEDACRLHEHQLSFFPIRELHTDSRFACNAVWFAVPNNPDGIIVPPKTISALCNNHPQTFFIVDNAYGELCAQSSSILPLHKQHQNLISVHSLTKTFAIPGLRLGYIVADASVIKRLQPLRTPWTVNTLAQAAGNFVMKNYDDLLPDCESLCRESAEFQRQLTAVPNLEVEFSSCNFFLVRLKKGTATELKMHLIEKQGILIRDASNFRGLSPSHFRLSVQCPKSNEVLIKALQNNW